MCYSFALTLSFQNTKITMFSLTFGWWARVIQLYKTMKKSSGDGCCDEETNLLDKNGGEATKKANNSQEVSKTFVRILEISNFASMLCVVDCTVLPIVTVLFPLIGLESSGSAMGWLHSLGRNIALYFVLPGEQ